MLVVTFGLALFSGGITALVNELAQLSALRKKGRLVALDAGMIAHQLRLQANGGYAIGNHLQGIERTQMHGLVCGLGFGRIKLQRIEECHPVFIGDRDQPFVVRLAEEQQVEHILELFGILFFGQQTVGQSAP